MKLLKKELKVNVMKASEYIKHHGDFEITEDIEKCIPHKPKSVWDLKKGDTCYYADIYNKAKESKWINDNSFKSMRSIGIVTLTAEELEFKIERMKVYEELKRYAKEFTDEEWKDYEVRKYYIFYKCREESISINYLQFQKNNCLYFESAEKAEEAVKAVGEERVKKYYLGVEK